MKGRNFLTALLVALISNMLILTDQAWARSQYDIKAAYLYNFIKFTNWPDESSKNGLNVCLYGEDPIKDKLGPLNSVKIRSLQASLKTIESVSDIQDCDAVYISIEEEKYVADIVAAADNQSILMVSDIADFIKQGGTIEFIALGNVIRFNINHRQAKKHQLSISSKLLELANDVTR